MNYKNSIGNLKKEEIKNSTTTSPIIDHKTFFNKNNTSFFNYNIILYNSIVLLRCVNLNDLDNLIHLSSDPSIWTYFALRMSTPQDITDYVNEAILQKKLGLRYTFVIENSLDKKAKGSTALGNYSKHDKRIEIGWSWLGTKFQSSEVNKNTKFLLLTFIFEYLNLERVEFKTDVLNQKSRRALLKIGATEEGILRSHTIMPDGRRRDTIYYSILKKEWPNIKSKIFSECSSLICLSTNS